MDFTLNEEQKILVALAKDFCKREVDIKAMDELADKPHPPNATKEELMARIPWDIISKAHDVGLRQLIVPKKYGGGSYGPTGDWTTVTAVAEAIGYWGGISFARLLTVPWKHCTNLLEAPQEIQDEFFPAFMNNRRTLIATSTSEPNHGSDLFLPYDEPGVSGKCIATRDGDYWVINGEKMFCTAGAVSDYIVVSVRTDPKGPISKSMSQFLFKTDTPGWSFRVNDMMGNEIIPNVQMNFDNCRVHKRYMVSKLNEAFIGLRSHLGAKSIHFMAALGDSQRIWEGIRDYAKQRIQGGKPIIQHPNVGILIAEGDVLLETARLLQYKFAWDCDEEKQGAHVNPLGFWYNNYWYKEVVYRLVKIGLEVYAGMGPQKELGFERWVRYNLGIQHGGGTGLLNLMKASKVL